jgi:hypothetical protein
VIGADHRNGDLAEGERAALVHPGRRVAPAGEAAGQPEAHLVDARPDRPQAAGQRDGVAHVVAVAVGDEEQVAGPDVRCRLRTFRVAEPWVDEDGLPPGVRTSTQAWRTR